MGIVAVKNLAEAGFDVTGFERSSYVGGLWHYTDDEETLSVLKGMQWFGKCGSTEADLARHSGKRLGGQSESQESLFWVRRSHIRVVIQITPFLQV